MRAVMLISAWGLCGCIGPDAPDVDVCKDFIHRLCVQPVCAPVALLLQQTPGCEPQLLKASGCEIDQFTFTSPTRARFLQCRVPLLRVSQSPELHPDCADVAESFNLCPDVVRMLKGMQ